MLAQAPELKWSEGDNWHATVQLPAGALAEPLRGARALRAATGRVGGTGQGTLAARCWARGLLPARAAAEVLDLG